MNEFICVTFASYNGWKTMDEYLAARFPSTKEVGLKKVLAGPVWICQQSVQFSGVKRATCLHMPAWASFGRIKKARSYSTTSAWRKECKNPYLAP